jgi:hypothetical protein
MVLKASFLGSITYSSMKAATKMVVSKYAIGLKSEETTALELSPSLVSTREAPRTCSWGC